MPLSTQPYKGMRDFYPEDKRRQKYMFSMLRAVSEWFGYEEYDAPVLEPTELFASKTSDEIVNEQTYTFEDRGGRSVTMRTEMTPSVSRMVAGKRQELVYPVRWYSIPNLWRYERSQKGRLREFYQLNIDLFGVPGVEGDLEMIQVADTVLQSFGAKRDMYVIKINSRKLLDKNLSELDLKPEDKRAFVRLLDKLSKMNEKDFLGEVEKLLKDPKKVTAVKELFVSGKAKASPELQKVLDESKKLGITNIEFDGSLARGFDYYTDFVFEIFDTNPENNRSMFGGGRYDGLVGAFGVEPVPTVGFAMGDVTLQNFLESNKLFPDFPPETDIWVLLAGDVYLEAQPAILALRHQRLRVAVDSSGRKLPAQLKAASKRGARYVVVMGEKELRDQNFALKDMQSGQENSGTVEELAAIIKAAE